MMNWTCGLWMKASRVDFSIMIVPDIILTGLKAVDDLPSHSHTAFSACPPLDEDSPSTKPDSFCSLWVT